MVNECCQTNNMVNLELEIGAKKKVAPGIWLLDKLGLFRFHPYTSYRIYVASLTFVCYVAYHMSRKPFSVVASVLAPNCTVINLMGNDTRRIHSYSTINGSNQWKFANGWPPFNGARCKTLIGAVDYSWLFTYALFMFASGFIADRVSIRYFLTIGMLGSGIFVGLLGVAYYGEIHHIAYFIVVQIFVGIFESTGWPGVVAVMGNWFGKKNRGLFLGIWNAHTSVGNILGTAIPSVWAVPGRSWAWSFLVPAFVMILVGVIMFLFLVTEPSHVGLPSPQHHKVHSYNQDHDSHLNDSRRFTNNEEHELSLSRRVTKREKLAENGSAGSITTSTEDWRNKSYSRTKNQSSETLIQQELSMTAISLFHAFKVPGVLEFSLALFFAKLVAYTFLFWLPYYIAFNPISGSYVGEQKADLMATLYDVGGIIGGVVTGAMSDFLNARAISSVIMMYLAVPTLFLYRSFGNKSQELSAGLIIMCGLFINGPYALITTAVSNDLGTHKSLDNNVKAKATVGAFIDGLGSLGAATGPLITGWVSDDYGWDHVFYVLMASCFFSSLMLTRLLLNEIKHFYLVWKERSLDDRRLLLPQS